MLQIFSLHPRHTPLTLMLLLRQTNQCNHPYPSLISQNQVFNSITSHVTSSYDHVNQILPTHAILPDYASKVSSSTVFKQEQSTSYILTYMGLIKL